MRKFFKAVAFVTIFSVLTRAMGFFLRIYLSRVMGPETLGAYQVSMSIFGVLMTLICSGLPLVISRNVAYYKAQGNNVMQHKNITAGLIISLIISTTVCVIIALCPKVLKLLISSDQSVQIILILCSAKGRIVGQKVFFYNFFY